MFSICSFLPLSNYFAFLFPAAISDPFPFKFYFPSVFYFGRFSPRFFISFPRVKSILAPGIINLSLITTSCKWGFVTQVRVLQEARMILSSAARLR